MTFTPQYERHNWTQADKIRAAGADAIEHIRRQRDLSDTGKRKRMAAIAVKTRDKLAELDADDRQRLTEKAAKLEQGLFRPTGRTAVDQMNARDAATRAAQVENPGQAARLFDVAHQLGDTVLAAAVARRAVDMCTDPITAERVWPLIHSWADQVPGARDALDELGAAENEQSDVMARMARSQHYQPGTIPELTGHNIDHLANLADDTTDQRAPTGAEQASARLASLGGYYNDAAG